MHRRTVVPGLGWFFLFTLLVACGDTGSPTVAELPRLAVEEELRIGSVDDPETILTYIGGMAVGEGGRIYSVHRQESSILVHGPDGDRLARIGGEGEGPGEFRGVGGVGFLGDTLWAYDYRLSRLSFFTGAGEVLSSVTIPIEMGRGAEGMSPPRPSGMLADGRLFGSPPAWSREVAAGTLTEVPVLYMDTTGAVGDTVFQRELSTWAIQDPTGAISRASYRSQPFADEPIRRFSQHGPFYVAVHRRAGEPADGTTTFRVAKITLDGDTVFDRTYPYSPEPIDPAYVDTLITGFAGAVAASDFGTPVPLKKALEWASDNLYVPEHLPPVGSLVIGRDGTLWLRQVAGEIDPSSTTWLVLDAAGEPVGRAVFPARFQLQVAERHTAWGWTLDELDVPYIVRYSVGRAVGDA